MDDNANLIPLRSILAKAAEPQHHPLDPRLPQPEVQGPIRPPIDPPSAETAAIARATEIVDNFKREQAEMAKRLDGIEREVAAKNKKLVDLELTNIALVARAERAEAKVTELQQSADDLRVFLEPIFVWGRKNDHAD